MRDSGFIRIEAQYLSVIPFYVPYILPMIRARRKDFQRALDRDWSRDRFETSIRRMYVERGWTFRTKWRRVYPQPWDMLREWEQKYRDKHPDYSSPWEPRLRRMRKSMRKIEATIEKYPRRLPKIRLRYKPEGGAEIVEE